MSEIPLRGGSINQVVRVGETVRRLPGPRDDFVHHLLVIFEQQGWTGAPRFLGIDGQGREVLSYLGGCTPADSHGHPGHSLEGLTLLARLVRQFHDLTAGTPLAGDQEVVCHNDLSPKNTVYSAAVPDRPIAFIDWDLVAPVAHMCWQYLNLGPDAEVRASADRLQSLCDAYGIDDRDAVVDTILWWQERCRRGIESGAAEGDAAMVALRNTGTVDMVRAAHAWVARHRGQLAAGR
ncbi:phosphotransferase [Nocardia vermiculata]|uniref:Phosphotransferase n=1 Tax=Nocardia vermiculata TaxID=257274 RepID=A0A846Y5Q1_9NOCA|nr:phosphotransferase [Nocardia vermiculata]NKY53240.1 phosphotransferase [Nocardia vermiculata]